MEEKYKEWIPIRDYENYYEVANTGIVRGIDRIITTKTCKRLLKGKVLQHKDNGYGYKFVMLCKHGSKRCFYIHRLVADAFLNNSLNKQEVNHINGNKSDNNVSNLEWATPSENAQHAFQNKLSYDISKHKATTYIFDNNRKRYFFTIRAAARKLGINYSTLRAMLKGRRKNSTSLWYMKCNNVHFDKPLKPLPQLKCQSLGIKENTSFFKEGDCTALAW